MNTRWLAACALTAVTLTDPARTSPPDHSLRQLATFDLPGPGGKRFDYLTIDAEDGYLLSAHLGAELTCVINLANNNVVATVHDKPGAEGVEYVPS